MSASRTPHLLHTTLARFHSDDPNAFAAPPLRIGAYELWFSIDTADVLDTRSGSVTVCIGLGEAHAVNLETALHLMLGLCLDLPTSSRGSVVVHPTTSQLIYRFTYALDDDTASARLMNAMTALATSSAALTH